MDTIEISTDEDNGEQEVSLFYPIAAKILSADAPELRKDFRQKISERTYQNLESLVWEGEVIRPELADRRAYQDAVRGFAFGGFPMAETCYSKNTRGMIAKINNSYKRAAKEMVDFNIANCKKLVELKDIDEKISTFCSMRKEQDRRYNEIFHSVYLKQLASLHKRRQKNPKEFSEKERIIIDYIFHVAVGFQLRQVAVHSRMQYRRVETLEQINPNLARVYISPILEGCKVYLNNSGKPGLSKSQERVDNSIKSMREDNALFCEILSRFEPAPEERVVFAGYTQTFPQDRQGTVTETQDNFSMREQTQKNERVYSIRDITGGVKLRHPSKITQFVVKHFISMVLNNQAYDTEVRERMADYLSRSRWHEGKFDDDAVKDYFSRLRRHAQQGRIPN